MVEQADSMTGMVAGQRGNSALLEIPLHFLLDLGGRYAWTDRAEGYILCFYHQMKEFLLLLANFLHEHGPFEFTMITEHGCIGAGNQCIALFQCDTLGGHLALEYALKYQENLAGIILRDTAASNAYHNTSKERALKSGLPGIDMEGLDRIFNGQTRSDEDFRELYKAILPLYFVSSTPEMLEETLNSITFRHETHNWAFSRNQPNFNIVDQLKTIQVPVLVLCGRHDWITPLEASEEIAREIPNSRLVVFENSGHSPQREERDKFLAECRSFLAEVFPTA